jgi:hypothetical protein
MSADHDPCELCGHSAQLISTGGRDVIRLRCPACGEYELTGSAASMLGQRSSDDRRRIAYWVFEQNQVGAVPTIASNMIAGIISRSPLGIAERADRLLLQAIADSPAPGAIINTQNPRLMMATHSTSREEILFLCELLQERGFTTVVDVEGGKRRRIGPPGYVYADTLKSKHIASGRGFVAMRFSKPLRPIYDQGFAPAIADAGFDPMRIDDVEHVDRIDDRIMAEIRRSRFVVADLTENNQGVYLEAGFALGLGLPVVWTCRETDIGNLHFDIRQFNHIVWSGAPDLRERLRRRIEFIIGRGPRPTVP